MKKVLLLFIIVLLASSKNSKSNNEIYPSIKGEQYLTVLGIAQDGGYPHIGCQKEYCANFYNGKTRSL
jgi:pyrroloquinoline quinone biosynthesis protein B